MKDHSDAALIEQPAVGFFAELDWETKKSFYEGCPQNSDMST